MDLTSFEEEVIEKTKTYLRNFPPLWISDMPNAWEGLLEMYPDNEPGMGVWDEIQSVITTWISGFVKEAEPETIQEYWEDNTDSGSDWAWERDNNENPEYIGVNPPLDEMCDDVGYVIFGKVLNEAEKEGIRREEERMEIQAIWSEPEEDLELIRDFLDGIKYAKEADEEDKKIASAWVNVLDSIPWEWPEDVPTLYLRESEGEERLIRFDCLKESIRISKARYPNDGKSGWDTMKEITIGDPYLDDALWLIDHDQCGMAFDCHIYHLE